MQITVHKTVYKKLADVDYDLLPYQHPIYIIKRLKWLLGTMR